MDSTQDLNYEELDRLMDRVKTKVFLDHNAAFLGSLMATRPFLWTPDIGTAATNGLVIMWNPFFFLKLPEATRLFVLLHEIWHIALLHMLRRGSRDPKIWNYACDILINNMLVRWGFTYEGIPFKIWLDLSYDESATAESIYEDLVRKEGAGIDIDALGELLGTGDILEPEEADPNRTIEEIEHEIVNAVVQATHASVMAGGLAPGNVTATLKRFLQPKLPWESLLFQWMNELAESDYTWRRPNRRHQEAYLPSLEEDEGRLDHLIYYLDVSGSVSDKDVIRFNSEVKFIKDQFNPKKLTLVQFDTMIQKEDVFEEQDSFDEMKVVGRGGTHLECVRQHIIEHNPTAAIIFSDLCVGLMDRLPGNIQTHLLWVGVNAMTSHVPHQGRVIHIKE